MPDQYAIEFLGSMACYDTITEEAVSSLTSGGYTFQQLAELMEKHGLSIKKVLHDPSRQFLSTYYADYQSGVYISITKDFHLEAEDKVLQIADRVSSGNRFLANKQWNELYGNDNPLPFCEDQDAIPLPMAIYDFRRRMKDIPDEDVFSIWHGIYKRIDYASGMWSADILDYVFSRAPKSETPPVEHGGHIILYRGEGALSQAATSAISWSTHPGNALWFANHGGHGTNLVIGEIWPKDVVAYFPGFYHENEVLVHPNSVRNIRTENMYPAEVDTFVSLTVPALPTFMKLSPEAKRLGYPEEGLLEYHGIKHILRVLLLSLIYFYHSGERLSSADKSILVSFSLLHDLGRQHEEEDQSHGDIAVRLIEEQRLSIKGANLNTRDWIITKLIIENHCRDDEVGEMAIISADLSGRQKKRAMHLYHICKDMDGLDRVRFNGLDYRRLRTPFAARLPLIAGSLLKEDVMMYCN